MIFHRWLTVVFVFAIFVFSSASADVLAGDRNGDLTVDMLDLFELAEYWLDDSGLVAHIKFDEVSGIIAYDSSRYGYDGTWRGDPVWDVNGRVGGCLTLDGNDAVRLDGYKGVAGTGARTVAAWIKTAVDYKAIVSWGDSNTPGSVWLMHVDTTGTLRVSVIGGLITGSVVVNDGLWHHVAAVFEDDGSPSTEDIVLYVDGVEDTGVTSTPAVITSGVPRGGVLIGYASVSDYFIGQIDDVRIYDRVLSASDIAEISTNCSSLECSDDNESPIGNLDHAMLSQNWLGSIGGPIVINEVLADNEDVLEDIDGQTSDWIELYNPTDLAVNIGGWYLTDDNLSLKWQFPADTFIGSGEYLLVFASGKDVYDPIQFHSNFKLNGDGEYLALVKSDGVTVSHAYDPGYGQQYEDISYGIENNVLKYFPSPTPGYRNSYGFAEVTPPPVFSHDGGTITIGVALSMTSSPGAQIFYSSDNSMPTFNSKPYSVPLAIPINRSYVIRARAYEPGKAPSPIVNRMFFPIDSNVYTFSSNLPIMIIETFEGVIPPSGSSEYLSVSSMTIDVDVSGRANITSAYDFSGRGGIRERGNSSTMFPKKQYAFETWDDYNEDRGQSILAFPRESDWVIHAPYSDKALMRNVLSYKWANDMGRYASRTKYIEVFMNTNGGRFGLEEYAGVYILMEKVKVDDDRVNVAEIEVTDNTEPEVTGGYLFKKDRMDPGDSGFWTDLGNVAYVEPKEDTITPQQSSWLQNYINEFESVLNGVNYDDPVNGYAKYIDVDSFIDQHIMVEATKNADGYRLSTYYYKDRNGKINIGPVWDYNLTMGNAYEPSWGFPDYFAQANSWYYRSWTDGHQWYNRLMQDEEFNIRYADRWFELRETMFSDESVLADIDYYYALLSAEAADRNFTRWDILNTRIIGNLYYGTVSDPHTYEMEVDWLKTWLVGNGTSPGWYSDHFDWFDKNVGYDYPPSFTIGGSVADEGDDVWPGSMLSMSGSGTIYYTTDGSDPRLRGGGISSNAMVYSGPVALTSDVTIKARTNDFGWSALNEASFHILQVVYINELMADNDSTIEDPDEPGEYPDWIELYNPGTTEVDLGDLYLTDNLSDPTEWKIPAGVTIPAGGYLIFWADSETTQGDTHVGFGLKANGEAVGLYSKDGVTAIDTISFEAQTSDVSYGRCPDGTGGWDQCSSATPGAANSTHSP